MAVAEELCTRVGIIADGALVADRDPSQLDGDLLGTFADEVSRASREGGTP